ncbi:hypothetical protein Tcan_03362 [Toxocara canis]|uniref:Uncharacterized protein n=1 Tax=Toxocara canis TaxID=6265 RepID=A0A0B2VRC5_TOXCA|nr:hypothetical protein Tcan_03362 [Toxocara canis]
MSDKKRRIAPKKRRCVRVLQNLMALPNVSLSVFLTQQFREYAAALNPRALERLSSQIAAGTFLLLDVVSDSLRLNSRTLMGGIPHTSHRKQERGRRQFSIPFLYMDEEVTAA